MNEPTVKNRPFSILWIIPVIALLAALWLAFNRLSNQGPNIQIQFQTAEGLLEGKTKIRYKSLNIGVVDRIELSEDLQHIIAHAKTTFNAKKLLKEDSSFWVVKPQVSASGISGLDTLLSGSYIAINPGESDKKSHSFVGLEEIPVIEPSIEGTRISLTASSAQGVSVGTPFIYRGIKVGQIERIQFEEPFDKIALTAFIEAPYDALISNNTKFWNIGGVNVNLNASGISVAMNSLKTLLVGGITFNTPTSFETSSTELSANKNFFLYNSEQEIKQPVYESKHYYVLYFDQSVRGLSAGAPVQFNGISLGQVLEVRLIFDEEKQKALIPVLIEIEPERIKRINNSTANDSIIATLVEQGLTAQLDMGNLLTGQKLITLSIDNKSKQSLLPDLYSTHLVLPTKSGSISEITQNINDLLSKINEMPLDELFSYTKDTAKNIRDLTNNEAFVNLGSNIESSLLALENTLDSITSVGLKADDAVTQLTTNLNNVTDEMSSALKGIGPNSPFYYQMNQLFEQMNETGQAIEKLSNELSDKPNSLIFGKEND